MLVLGDVNNLERMEEPTKNKQEEPSPKEREGAKAPPLGFDELSDQLTPPRSSKQGGNAVAGPPAPDFGKKPAAEDSDGAEEKEEDAKKKSPDLPPVGAFELFKYATPNEKACFLVGTLCACINGASFPGLALLIGDVSIGGGSGDGGDGGDGGGRLGGTVPDHLPEGAVNRCSCGVTKHAFARLMLGGGGDGISGGVGGGLLLGGLVRRGAVPDDPSEGAVHLCSRRMAKHALARLIL